jgi:hypothetical protein
MKICLVLFTSLLLLSAQAGTGYSDAIPGWAKEVFSQKLAARYVYFNRLHPSHLEADFNGDKKQDVAILIRNKSSRKIGIAIVLPDKGITILGAGTPFGNGGDNFDWMDRWSTSKKGNVNAYRRRASSRKNGFSQRDSLLGWERISVVSTRGLSRGFPAAQPRHCVPLTN